MVLLSWGMAVLAISGLLSWWIYSNQQAQAEANAEVQREQDRAMCALVELFTTGPEPVSGPEGDRQRVILQAMRDYQGVLHCEDFALEPPVTPRTRPPG
jgi:hypothetical protein